MIIVNFRPHKPSFKESMEEAKTFRTVGSLRQYLGGRPEIKYYTYDLNTNADTFIITDGGVIGFMWFTNNPAKSVVDALASSIMENEKK